MTAGSWLDLDAPAFGAAPTPSSRSVDLRGFLSLLALVTTFAAVISLFAISPVTLEGFGINYIESGGGILAKVHPATPLAMAALSLRCLAARRPLRTAWRLVADDAGVVLLLTAAAIAGVFAVVVDKTPVTPLIDSFVLPAMVFPLLRDMEGRASRTLAFLVAAVLVLNAGLALFEYLRGMHFVPIDAAPDVTADPTQANMVFSWQAMLTQDWRAVALLGHPLVNGLVVGSFVLCLAAPGSSWIPGVLRYPALALSAVSLPAFGARTALVLTVALAAWLVLSNSLEAIGRGERIAPRRAAAIVLLAGCALLALALVVESGMADRILDRFTDDAGSASTRITMFALFSPMTLTDLVLHPDKDLVATLQRIYGLEFGIESSWLGLALTYGLVVTAMLAAGFLAFWRSVLRASGRGGAVVFALFLVLVSVSASLSGKTTVLAMVASLVVLFLRKDAPAEAARRRVKGR